MKQPVLLPLLLAGLVALSGCGLLSGAAPSSQPPPPAESPEAPKALTQVRLPYFGEDTLNPYNCETLQNFSLSTLLCDGLVALDGQNRPVNRLALDITGGPQSYVVSLRGDAVFSDGATLSADDLLYSLELARQSPRYSAGLAGVADATAQSSSMVVINLAAPDIYFTRSLSFPILRKDTGEFPMPMGVGRFLPRLEDGKLVRNDDHYSPVQNIREVLLVDTDSLEEQSYGIMEGTIDLMYSDLQSDLNLGLGIGYRQIPLSNMVYLLVNHTTLGDDRAFRQVLSGLVRREELARRAYTGFAAVTSLPISPVAATTSFSASDLEVHPERQKQALEEMGWTLQEDGSRWRNGQKLRLRLLVNNENTERRAAADLIAESYRQAGMEIELVALPFDKYTAAVAAGDYDLCIAEMKIPYNMDIGKLLLGNPTDGPGPAYSPALTQLWAEVQAGDEELSQAETLLREELPVIPLLFRRGILCFSRDFSANIVATEQDIFYNIEEW